MLGQVVVTGREVVVVGEKDYGTCGYRWLKYAQADIPQRQPLIQ